MGETEQMELQATETKPLMATGEILGRVEMAAKVVARGRSTQYCSP